MKKFYLLLALAFISIGVTTTAQTNNALRFDGANDFIDISNNAAFQLNVGTIETWFKTSGAGGGHRGLIIKQFAYGIFIRDDNKLVAYDWVTGETNTNINVADGLWHHVAMSFDATVNTAKLYLDGYLVLTRTFAISNQTVGLVIGNGSSPDNGQAVNAMLDEVRIWNVVRTQQQIIENMSTLPIDPIPTGLLAYYPFNQGVADNDNTGINTLTNILADQHHGTLNNFALTGTTSNWVTGYDSTDIVRTLVASNENLHIDSETGSTTTFTITSNTAWEANSSEDWLTISPLSGYGNDTFTVTTNSQSLEPRSAIVTIKGKEVDSVLVTITQEISTITVSPDELNFDGFTASNIDISLTTNTNWTATPSESWVTLDTTSGSASATINVSVPVNPNITERTAQIVFTGIDAENDTVKVAQQAGPPTLSVSSPTASIGEAFMSTGTFTITSNTSWTISNQTPWLLVSVPGGTGNATISLVVQENTTSESRSGSLTISNGDTTITFLAIQFKGNGTLLNPFLISDYNHLKGIKCDSSPFMMNFYYLFTANIDASPSQNENNGEGFIPIQSEMMASININGDNHTISGLYINRPTTDNIGLFGNCSNSEIQNLGLINANINGRNSVGGIAGRIEWRSTITNCYSSGSITGSDNVGGLTGSIYESSISNSYSTGSVSGSNYLGGLAGSIYNSTITNCYSSGSVNGTDSLGGIAGRIHRSTITDCYSTGSVSGSNFLGGISGNIESGSNITNCYSSSSITGSDNIGGITGYIVDANISNSYSTGSVSGSNYLGGIAGRVEWWSTISNSYSTGSISGTDTVGGLAGNLQSESTITNCYSTGQISGSNFIGGLVGNDFGGTVTNSFWDITTSGQTTSAGGIGLPSLAMKLRATYTDATWDFRGETDNIWNIGNGRNDGYPYFNREYQSDIVVVGLAEILTNGVINITAISAISGGEITNNPEGISVFERGICWSTSENPDLTGNYSSDGQGSGTFVSEIDGLSPNTEYYIRAFAINANGIVYGNQIIFSSKLELTLGGTFTANDKEYDGNAIATINNNSLELIGVGTTHDVTIANVTLAFDNLNVGNYKTVNIVNVELTGIDAEKYALLLLGAPTATANITQAVGTETNVTEDLSVYPNPFNNNINLSNTNAIARITITNIVGQTVFERLLNGESSVTISTNELTKGIYLVTFQNLNGDKLVKKIIKE